MAIADKNILITPNISGILGNQPNVVFTGADSSIGDSAAITVTARPENSGTLSFTGTAGQLFSITNSLEGTIFAVNDVSGIPSLEIDDAGIIKMAEFNGRILLGGASDDSVSTLQITGAVTADSATISGNITAKATYPKFRFQTSDTSVSADQQLGEISWSAPDEASGTDAIADAAFIEARAQASFDATGNETDLFFGTGYSGAAATTMRLEHTGLLNLYANDGARGSNVSGIKFNHGTLSSTGQANVIFSNSAGQIAFGMDGNTSQCVFVLDDENGQPIFTFQEEGAAGSGTKILDGGNTDVTTHKDFLFDSANAIMFDKSDQALEVNSSLYSIDLVDNAQVRFGSSNDGYIQHSGSNLQMINNTGGIQITNTANDNDVDVRSDDGSGGTALYFKADGSTGKTILYNYGNQKFETLDSGVNITGTLRVNNAEIASGASAGFAIAMAIAL